MGYPQKLLGPNEQIQYQRRPAFKIIIIPVLVGIGLIIGLTIAASTLSGLNGTIKTILTVAIILLATILGIWLCVKPIIRWATTLYVLTNRRIITRTGLIATHGRDMPLSKVNDVSFQETFVERLFGVGTLTVASAGESGPLVIKNVAKIQELQRTIYELHDQDDAWRRNRNHTENPPT